MNDRPTLDDLVNAQTAYVKASEAVNARKLGRLIRSVESACLRLDTYYDDATRVCEVRDDMLRAALKEALKP